MNIVARFYSNAQTLMLHAPVNAITVIRDGMPVIETPPPAAIEFANHIHDSFSKEEAELLRKHSAFDKLFHEIPLPTAIAAATGDSTIAPITQNAPIKDGDVVMGVKSKSEALNYLAVTKQVDPAELKALKSVDDIKKFALEKFKITFKEWE